jgi:small subunit ribosomal protein S35
MTENRRNELEQYRQTLAEKDQQRELTGQLVDGIRQIEDGLKQSIRIGESAPEMVTAHASRGRGSPKRLAVRR